MDAQMPSATAASRSVTAWFARRCRPLPWLLSASLLTTSIAPPAVFAAGPKLPLLGKKSKPAATGPAKVAAPQQTAIQQQSTPPAKSVAPGEDPTIQNELKVKLNYFGADWAKVLKEVAEGTNSVLIADRVPSGRYTRRDKTEYTRTDALRIINREIEPHGFRVIEKGQYLIVIDLPSQRPRYQTPVVEKPPSAETGGAATPPPRKVTRVVDGRTPPAAPPARNASGVQLAGYEEPAAEQVAEPAPKPSPQLTMVVFRARNQRANDLAKRLYHTFKDRAELVKSGRNGLPAFKVSSSTTGDARPAHLFSMAIDAEKEELLIDAPAKEADAVVTLLRRLDTDEHTLEEPSIQLVASTKAACEAAVKLPEQFALLKQARDRLVAQVDAEAPADKEPEQKPANAENKEANPTLSQMIGNINTPVNVEAIPDLNVLIMSGSEADIERIKLVIRELEKLSQALAPEVHILYLKHVNSEALAELLSTVYERLATFPGKTTQPRQGVAILPVSKPNAILIIAPTSDIEAITELAEELDSPVDPETELQVFTLQTAIATQVEEMLTEFFDEEDRTGLGTKIVVRADARSNSIIVRASPRDLDQVSSLLRKVDSPEPGSKAQLRVYQLKNAVATELMAVLTAAINSVLAPPSNTQQNQQGGFGGNQIGGGGQVAEQFRDVRSMALEILADGPEGRRLQSGILSDIRITSDPRMNSLLVTAPEASQSLMAQLIENLDRPTGQVAEIKVFTLANADANQMVQQLQQLFNPSAAGQTGNNQRTTIGIQVAGAEDASSGLIPLRFSVDTRTNSVIAIGASDAMSVVNSIIFRLDESDARGRQESIYRLKNSPATTISDAITQFLTSQRDIRQQDPNLFSTVEQLEREVIVVPEPVSNSLLVSATPRYFDEIMKLIEKLDEAPRQVIIQALLVEVTLDNTDELGVELGFQDSILFDRSILDQPVTITETNTLQNGTQTTSNIVISQSGQPGFLFGNPATPLGNNLGIGNNGRVGGQSLSNFGVGRVNGDLGYGGLVLSASSESISMLLRALSANRQTRILSRPQIRTLDNQQAEIFQGQMVPIVTAVNQAAAGTVAPTTSTVQQQQAGIILSVTPRISPDGNIVMQLQAEKSKFDLANGVPIFTDQTTGNTVRSPIQDISRARSTIMVPNGQTVVLGGLITSAVDNIERKVPWLGDIPILGWAFRYDYQKATRTELLVFLTPRIITNDAESEHISEVEIARMHFIESEAEEIHGPLRGVPAAEGYPVEPLMQPLPYNTIPGGQPILIPATPQPIPQSVTPPPPTPAVETPAPPQPGVYDPSGTPKPGSSDSSAEVTAPPAELPATSTGAEPQLGPSVQPSLYEVDQDLMKSGSARVSKNSSSTLVSAKGKKNPVKLPGKATTKQQASSPGTVRLGR